MLGSGIKDGETMRVRRDGGVGLGDGNGYG